jgi:hypothetical protein
MQIAVVIDAQKFRDAGWDRQTQFERTNVANLIRLFADRVAMGMSEGVLVQNDITLSFKVERSPAPADQGKAA